MGAVLQHREVDGRHRGGIPRHSDHPIGGLRGSAGLCAEHHGLVRRHPHDHRGRHRAGLLRILHGRLRRLLLDHAAARRRQDRRERQRPPDRPLRGRGLHEEPRHPDPGPLGLRRVHGRPQDDLQLLQLRGCSRRDGRLLHENAARIAGAAREHHVPHAGQRPGGHDLLH